ncbi:MAG: MBL fold metallo-hydrolase [Chloroflexia bacterium]
MKVTLWGARGSIAAPGHDTLRYGGNTSCVEVRGSDGTILALDAGTGLRALGLSLPHHVPRVDILLTHLHMDHIQGLGFFHPLRDPDCEVHIWGPSDEEMSLREGITRYLSPPLFPVHLDEMSCKLVLHTVPGPPERVGEFSISGDRVCHTNLTVGYRLESQAGVLAYIPDHEPAFCSDGSLDAGSITSGYGLASGADILIHDALYNGSEYERHVGWGHSSMQHTFEFGALTGVKRLVPFHHNPSHTDAQLDQLIAETTASGDWPFEVVPGREGSVFYLGDAQQEH